MKITRGRAVKLPSGDTITIQRNGAVMFKPKRRKNPKRKAAPKRKANPRRKAAPKRKTTRKTKR
jgi:hypothetical protein